MNLRRPISNDKHMDAASEVSPTTRILEFVSQDLLGADETLALAVDDDLLASGDIDSMGIMRLIGFIEEEFSRPVPPEDVTIENFGTIAAIGAYVDRLLSKSR